jgi:hypothetical protein
MSGLRLSSLLGLTGVSRLQLIILIILFLQVGLQTLIVVLYSISISTAIIISYCESVQ